MSGGGVTVELVPSAHALEQAWARARARAESRSRARLARDAHAQRVADAGRTVAAVVAREVRAADELHQWLRNNAERDFASVNPPIRVQGVGYC